MTTSSTDLAVRRLPQRLSRDASRTIARFFWPPSPRRARSIVKRVMRMGPETVSRMITTCVKDFGDRYEDLLGIFDHHYREARERISFSHEPTPDQAHLIGAYFTMEYAYASAAFFNPSMVPAMDQGGLEEGSTRFIMSLRAVGEGHISSIVFRRGVLDADCNITIDPVRKRSRRLRVVEGRSFPTQRFRQKRSEAGAYSDIADAVFAGVGEEFTLSELTESIG
ncbi:MAG: glycosidase, partial [Planctomycetota bacterium]